MKVTRTSQPQGSVGIDAGNPLARGLVSAVIPALGVDSVSGRTLTAVGSATTAAPGATGMKMLGTGNSVRYAEVTPTVMTGWTAFVLIDGASTLTDKFYCGVGNASSASPLMGVISGNLDGSKIRVWARADSGSNTVGSVSTSRGVTDGKPHSVATVCTQAAISSYVDGIFDATTAQVTGTYTATKFAVCANWRSGAMATPTANNVYVALLFNRALSDAEIRSISANPWQLFSKIERPIFVSEAAAGGSYTATTDVGILTLSGYAPTVTQSGSTATTLTPANGTLTLIGNVPTLTQTANQSVTAGVGTVAITGYAPSVSQSASGTIQPGVGSITLTGNAPTVTQSANQSVTPAVGSVSITGYAPTVTKEINVTPDVGSLTVNGYAPTIQQTANQVIVPGFGTFTIDGWEPTVTRTADTATVARPASDTSNTGWTANGAATLSGCLNEVTPSDAEYISASSVGAVCQLALNATAYPGTASQVLKYRASSPTGNSVIVRLKNAGGSTIRSATQALTAVDTEYSITLTSGEIESIASGSLSVELESA